MKIVIVRHGEPNYVTDSLLEHGRQEAAALAEYLKDAPVDAVYCSPLGRAKETCEFFCQKKGLTPVIKEWLREFHAPVNAREKQAEIFHPEEPKDHIPWDMKPSYWTEEPLFFHPTRWKEVPLYAEAGVGKEYDRVVAAFDALLAEHGYARENNHYRVTNSNHDTLYLFCHMGVECVLLSRLLDLNPVLLWHHTAARCSSFTTVVTEEREKGIATFRMLGFGETAHLTASNVEPSFACRFSECFEDPDRH